VSLSLTNEHNSSAIETDILGDTDAYFQLRNDLIALGLDPTSGRQEGTLNAIGAELQRSTAGNLLDATRGYQIALHAEAAGRFLPGSYNYTALSADGRHYLPLGDGVVLATRLQVGSIEVAGSDPANVPFSKKYFLGGASTMRGWGRYEVSPLSGSGLPLGGNSLVAFSGELRLRLKGSLGGVLFLDAGNVWADRLTAVDLGDLRYAVGPGLRYQTPVGPVRLDVGYQLTPIEGLLVNGEPEKRRWRIHFSIGQAF
jgi:outer membrane translocation and assembly module TamA